MATFYLRNTHTNQRYQVVKVDPATNKVTLKGPLAQFEETYDKDRFKQMGYVLEKEE